MINFNKLGQTLFLLLSYNITLGQQNFFNVPSSDITPKNKSFFQQQLNIYNQGLQFNSTYDIGLGKGFEVGINYLGFSIVQDTNLRLFFNDTLKPYSPFLILNGQKRFSLNNHIGLAIGGQFGFTTTSTLKGGSYCFSNFIYNNEAIDLKTILGLYCASNSFFGEGDRLIGKSLIGVQAGLEKSIIKDKILFQADFISGQHNFGELVIGGAYFLTKNWILSAGYQIPTFSSSSVNSIVLELTYSPKK